MRRLKGLFLLTLIALVTFSAWGQDAEPTRERAALLVKNGNYKEALAIYRKLCLDPKTEPEKVGNDLNKAAYCISRLGRLSELDGLREETIRIHADNWRLLFAAAKNYNRYSHHGFRVAGEFHRGQKRSGGERINAWERDRVRALQLMRRAEKLARSTPGSTDFVRSELGTFYLSFSQMLISHRGQQQSWKLTGLTDLSKLPDLEPGYYGHSYRGTQMAPVDAQGNPVFHAIPESFEKARTDGERWRWALLQVTELGNNYH